MKDAEASTMARRRDLLAVEEVEFCRTRVRIPQWSRSAVALEPRLASAT